MKKNTGKNVQGIEENAVVRLKAFVILVVLQK